MELVRDDLIGLKIGASVIDHKSGELALEKGKRLKVSQLDNVDFGVLARLDIENKPLQRKFTRIVNMAAMEEAKLIAFRDQEINNLRKGDDLPPGVI